MQGISGIAAAFSFLTFINPFLQALVYISIIVVSYKALEALNVYIKKNSQ
jgi:hypothetical protein